jgi:predicted nucleic acid-binding protein
MIADTTFLSDLYNERTGDPPRTGPACNFLSRHRRQRLLATVISAGELAVMFADTREARIFLGNYRVLRLTPEIAYVASAVDRELIRLGARLGENDNWIAGFCCYYGQPIISRDRAFDRVRGLRRLAY